MTWALILASARQIVRDSNSVRNGAWQTSIGRELKAGCWACWVSVMSATGRAHRHRLRHEGDRLEPKHDVRRRRGGGATWSRRTSCPPVGRSDYSSHSQRAHSVTCHSADIAPHERDLLADQHVTRTIVDEVSLVQALTSRSVAGAALDVFTTEPLPVNHPFRTLDKCWPRLTSDMWRRISIERSTAM